MENRLSDFVPYEKGTRILKGQTSKPEKNPLSKQPGCYVITHVESEKHYVGSSVNLAGRISSNLTTLKDNKHKNKNLQQLFNENPNVEVVVKQTQTVEEARQLEQETVDKLLPLGKLCNIGVIDVTRARFGLPVSEDTRRRTADAIRGQKRSEESRIRMREAQLGKILSEEQKQKLSVIHKERLSSEEGKAAHSRGIEKRKHPVVCDGVNFSSVSEAARELKVDVTTIMYRCKSENFPGYFKKE